MKSTGTSTYFVPGAIVITGGLIALALFAGGDDNVAASGQTGQASAFGNNLSRAALGLNTVNASEHIRGNPDAPVSRESGSGKGNILTHSYFRVTQELHEIMEVILMVVTTQTRLSHSAQPSTTIACTLRLLL